jgi:predicted Zn-dependent protease
MGYEKHVELNGEIYTWDGYRWVDSSSIIPPHNITLKLNALIKDEVEQEDSSISDEKELLKRVHIACSTKQYDRAENILRHILSKDPSNLSVISVLCAVLREKGLSDKAIEETSHLKHSKNLALSTCRSAALCDMGLWEDAKKEIGRVLAVRSSDEAFNVVKRIKKHRPDLYDKD